MLNFLLEFLSPPYCVSCQRWGNYFCDDCFGQIKFLTQQLCPECKHISPDGTTHPVCQKKLGLNGHLSAALYHGPIKKLIHRFKYGRYPVKNLSLTLDKILTRYLTSEEDYFPPKTIVAPVPLYWWRENKRGYNQSLVLAKTISRLWQLNLLPNLLIRTRLNPPQAKLPKKDRQKNVNGLFQLNKNLTRLIKNQKIILVDDVYTTGATLKECVRVLKGKGRASQVYAVTLAYDEKKMIK